MNTLTQAARPDIASHNFEELFQFGGALKHVRREHQRLMPFFATAQTVLDVGCGRGVFLEMLRESGISAVGVDAFSGSVARCRALGFERVYQADALTYLASQSAAFDGIVCSHIIEHLPYADATTLMRDAWNALRPGGRLAIVTPNARDINVVGEWFWLDPTHVRPYPLQLLDSMLQAAGFAILHRAQPTMLPNKRAIPRWLLLSLLLGPHFGRPNTLIIGEKPREGAPTR